MGGGTLRFNRPRISFISEDEHTVQSIPQLIDFNANANADYPFCIQAEKALLEDFPSFLHVTHAQLKHAICRCAQWLRSSVQELVLPEISEDGVGTRKGSPIALLLNSDINLLVHAYTLMSLGVPALLLSARLSPAAAQHLLSKTSARGLIHSTRLAYKAKEIRLVSQKPNCDPINLYAANGTHFWFSPTARDVDISQSICQPGYDGGDSDRNILILHSSGTTGLPKPIYTSHKYLLSFVTCHAFTSEDSAQGLNLSTLPLYHGYGLVTPALSLGLGKTFCIPISSVNPTASSVIQLLDSVSARCLMTVPSILEEIIDDAVGVHTLAQLDFVAFGGGNLKPAIGHGLAAAGVNLLNHFGTTESGPLAPIFIPGSDYEWQYFRLRRDIKLRIEPNSTINGGDQHFKLTTYPPGWDKPFEIQDRFVTSPRNPMVDFNAIGRMDNVIVLATGEKVHPMIIETVLSEHSLVSAAAAFGDGHFQLGVIVQPSHEASSDDIDEFKTSIWPTILEGNELMDAHARITSKDSIIVVPYNVALPRSDKGSLLCRELHSMFSAEIEEAYQKLESSSPPQKGQFVLDRNRDLTQQLKDHIQNALPKWNVPAQDWIISDDLFNLGMDSLQAVELRRLLLPSIEYAELIPRDFVYRHPSVLKLAEAIDAVNSKQELAQPVSSRQKMVDDSVEQYSLRQSMTQKQEQEENFVILLTGSTGSLGCHLVAHLASLPIVKEIVCLMRPASGRDQDPKIRQDDALRDKLISLSPEVRQKITTIQATLSLPQLGLGSEAYNSLLPRVTHILHNAWPMDFNRRLSSFESQFQAVQNLLSLALDASKWDGSAYCMGLRNRVKFVFVSSIAVVGEYPGASQGVLSIPEISISDVMYTNRIGYAEAKLVCERIVQRAQDDFPMNLEAASIRMGQISGSVESGFWNTDEHVAALLKSSATINALPALEGTLSWLPVNIAASSISDILLSKMSTTPIASGASDHTESQLLSPIYHLENPVRWSWNDVLSELASLLSQESVGQVTELPRIPYSTWLDRVLYPGDTTKSSNSDNGGQRDAVPVDENLLGQEATITLGASPHHQLEKTLYVGKDGLTDNRNPAYSLAEFFATDFRRMACGSVVLDTRMAYQASPSFRDFASIASDVGVRNEILERYVGYWRRCKYL